jgi:glutamate synthase (NADPH/NADH) small chain
MGKPTGFLEQDRRDPGYRPVEERTRDFRAVELQLAEEELLAQAARCMDCGVPFCHGCGCPLANQIPELNDLVYRGRWKEALELLLATNNFPEFTGRICPALCEGSCVLGINREPVTIRQIELAIIEKAFELGFLQPRPPAERRPGHVAVIGSGPAGLAVADVVNRAGYNVVVYDSAARPGGILRYGIPEFKLEKAIVDRRTRLMEAEGVVFESGVTVGQDVSFRYLLSRFQAVCLSGGAREPRDIRLPGRELKGIHFAMEFLTQQNRRLGGERVAPDAEISAAGRNVLVLGGGDTGADCLGTAIRQGAAGVVQAEILPEPPAARAPSNPWPAWPLVRRDSSSHKEGGERLWSVAAQEFVGDDAGRVKAVRFAKVEWVTPPGGGRPEMKPVPGSEFTVAADLVLLAMGFVGFKPNRLAAEFSLAVDERGMVKRDAANMSSVRGIFMAGDMAQGASLVVRAIADGRKTAQGIIRYLEESATQ